MCTKIQIFLSPLYRTASTTKMVKKTFRQRVLIVLGLIVFTISNVRSQKRSSDVHGNKEKNSISPVFPQINQHGLLTNNTFFTLNGTELRILSGAMHYFRIPHQYWQDRLERLKALGLNTVETYVAWNVHEPSPGHYLFDGDLDVRTFIQTAHRVGLHVIFRPGPYICAEWDFGGLPSWLLRDANMRVRTLYAPFMQSADTWFGVLFKQVRDLQHMRGGPIIAMQVENEYGSFGTDLAYEKAIGNIMLKHGATELLFTADGYGDIHAGRIDGVFETLTGQWNLTYLLGELKRVQPNQPLMVMEFWSGWFDHWGDQKHNTLSGKDYTELLKTILVEHNASVNLYMVHGGTNFGFMAGANVDPSGENNWLYGSDVTSYDYDAPVSEDGSPHATKFNATRSIIASLNTAQDAAPLPPIPPPPRRAAYGTISPNGYLPLYPETSNDGDGREAVSMLGFVKQVQHGAHILPMELLDINNGSGQQYGYILYRTDLDSTISSLTEATLTIEGGVRDRLTVFYDGVLVQQQKNFTHDNDSERSMSMQQKAPLNFTLQTSSSITGGSSKAAQNKKTLNLLVENRGRANFARRDWPGGNVVLNDQRKGLRGNVTLTDATGMEVLRDDWSIYPLQFEPEFIAALTEKRTAFRSMGHNVNRNTNLRENTFPAMLRYEFELDPGDEDNVHDSFLHLPPDMYTKGVAFVNGHNIGRFWSRGPQRSLYIPKWYWRAGVAQQQQCIMLFVEEVKPVGDYYYDDNVGNPATKFVIELKDTHDLGIPKQ